MLTLNGRPLAVPILQGGMGVGVSMGGLAGAVASCGALGCVSSADAGYDEPDFAVSPHEANLRALHREIRRAKQTAQGAGLPLDLPGLVPQGAAAIAPIVSGGRAARLILKRWAQKFGRTADFIVVEGCRAGGHLGFDEKELLEGRCRTLEEILPEVLTEVRPYEERFGRPIPVFAAGGVYTGADMARLTKLGAAGVQMATRFIATYECDASQAYKDVLLNARAEDVRIIHSPVGMPGRALATPLIRRLEQGERIPPRHCSRCLAACDPGKIPYCITHALTQAVRGDLEESLFFCGDNVGRLDRMMHVSELIDEVMTEWRQHQ